VQRALRQWGTIQRPYATPDGQTEDDTVHSRLTKAHLSPIQPPIGVKRGVGDPVARARWRRCFAFSLAFLLFARIVLLDLAVFFTWGSDLHGIGHFLADILNGGHRLSAGLRCHYRKRLPQPLAIALADLISHCRQLGGHILRPPSGLHRSSSSPTDKSRRLVMPSRCQGLAFRLRP
jgi:hypothetical protein